MLIEPWALKSLNNIEKIQPMMMVAMFNGNSSATIIYCYCPAMLVKKRPSLPSMISYPPLIIGGDTNARIVKNVNHKFNLHNSLDRNGEHLTDFMPENRLTCFNTKFQKRNGKLWTTPMQIILKQR